MTHLEKFKENKFVVVRNAIDKQILNFLLPTFFYEEENNLCTFGDSQVHNSPSLGNSPSGSVLAVYLKPQVENIVDKKLHYTYNYYRIYQNESELRRHVDRGSCEYSLTICIKKGSCDYPIFFKKDDGTEVSVELEDGDMIIYKGMELPHWRKKYQGDKHIQMFIHYVDKDGYNSVYKNDDLLKNIGNYS